MSSLSARRINGLVDGHAPSRYLWAPVCTYRRQHAETKTSWPVDAIPPRSVALATICALTDKFSPKRGVSFRAETSSLIFGRRGDA
jgi:hypothetical protein